MMRAIVAVDEKWGIGRENKNCLGPSVRFLTLFPV